MTTRPADRNPYTRYWMAVAMKSRALSTSCEKADEHSATRQLWPDSDALAHFSARAWSRCICVLCAQGVVGVVHEEVVLSSPFLVKANLILRSVPFVAVRPTAPLTLYLSHLKTAADVRRFQAEEPDQPRRIIQVSGGKKTHCRQIVLSSKQTLRTPPILTSNVGRSPE